jgi:hypothetical protein
MGNHLPKVIIIMRDVLRCMELTESELAEVRYNRVILEGMSELNAQCPDFTRTLNKTVTEYIDKYGPRKCRE